jgi:hypothetical protein
LHNFPVCPPVEPRVLGIKVHRKITEVPMVTEYHAISCLIIEIIILFNHPIKAMGRYKLITE